MIKPNAAKTELVSRGATRRAVLGVTALALPGAILGGGKRSVARPPSFVDERVELLGIAARLAQLEDFRTAPPSAYSADIGHHFASFASHPLVQALQQEARPTADARAPLSAWDVLALAFHLGPPPDLAPLVPPGHAPADARWDGRRLFTPERIAQVQDFYRTAQCGAFFASQRSFFAKADASLKRQLGPVDGWVANFTGLAPTERYRPVASFLGAADFGYFRVNFGQERRDTYTVFAIKEYDARGLPAKLDYPAMASMIAHETIHAYVNQVIDRNLGALQGSAQYLLERPAVWAKFSNTFYNNAPFLLRESFVRATALILSGDKQGIRQRESYLALEVDAGFEWMPGLVALLETYRRHRVRYPNLDAFAPDLIAFFRDLAAH